MITRQIIALGGGGFSTENTSLADKYILSCADASKPKISFLPTASGDSERYIDRFYAAFADLECHPSHLSLFRNNVKNISEYLDEQNIIYVGGGNTKSMLALWKEWGIDLKLKDLYHRGTVLAGTSAGAICWFERCITDSYCDEFRPLDGLSFLPGSACPHYGNNSLRDRIFTEAVVTGALPSGFGIPDAGILHFHNEKLFRSLTSNASGEVMHATPDTQKYLQLTPLDSTRCSLD